MAELPEWMKREIKNAIENAQSDKEKEEVLKNFCNGFVRNSKGQTLGGIGGTQQAEAIRDLLATMDKSQIETTLANLPKQNQDIVKEVMEDMAKEEPAKEEPVKEEPAKEEPVKEEPIKEEPVKEEPVKEELAKESAKDIIEQIKSLSDRKKSQIIIKGQIELNGKKINIQFSDAAIVDIISSMENPQEIYEVIKRIKDPFIMLNTMAEKQPENMKRLVRERGISNKKFAEWEAARQGKEQTPEIVDVTYEMEEEQEKEQEGHHRQSRKFKEYARYIEKRDPVPGTAATIESLKISAEEKAMLVEMLAAKLGKEKETEILKYLTDEKLKAAVQGREEAQKEEIVVEQAAEEPEKETVKEEKHKYSHKFKEYARYIEKGDPVPGTAATIEGLDISAEEKEKLTEMLIERLGKEKEPEILSAKAAFERGRAEAAKKAEAAKEAETVKEQETADKKQPSPLIARIKSMLEKIKEQIIEMEKVNEAIKEGMHKDAEMTKAEGRV